MTDATGTETGTETQDANPGGQQGEPKPTFTAEQQAELNRIVAREKKAAADKAKADAKAERDAADDEARKAKDADDARKAGDFEKVEGQLRGDLTSAVADRDAVTAERDELRAFFDGQVAAALKTLPDALKDFDPGPAAPFAARKAWLEKALKRAAEVDRGGARGNGANPPVAQGTAPTQAQTTQEMRALMGIRR